MGLSIERRFPFNGSMATQEDLELLEVFCFFNYPQLPSALADSPVVYGSLANLAKSQTT